MGLCLATIAATAGCSASSTKTPGDLAVTPDLASVDQAVIDGGPPDSAVPDLGTGDLAATDLAAFDLGGSDGASVDLNGSDMASAPIDVRGVYLVTSPASVSDGTTAAGLLVKGVDGVLVNTAWNHIESDSGVFDFSEIDDEAQLAVNAGKKFEIALKTGGSEPQYVFSHWKATQLTLLFAPKAGASGCDTELMAAPWDPGFLAAYDDLLSRLSQHLKDVGLYSELTMLRITVINGQSDELRLPAQEQTVATCLAANPPITVWSTAGYTPTNLLTALNAGIASFNDYFPDKSFNIAIINGGALPPIEDNGTIDTGATAKTQEATQINNLLAAAAQALPGRLAIQWNGVSDLATNPLVLTEATLLNTRFGWQSDEWGGETEGAECGANAGAATACKHATFQTLLNNGLYPAGSPMPVASYFELFAPNVTTYTGLTAYTHNSIFAP